LNEENIKIMEIIEIRIATENIYKALIIFSRMTKPHPLEFSQFEHFHYQL